MSRYTRFRSSCCGKSRYATESAAQAVLDRIAATSTTETRPVRAYQCDNGWWHLTSRPAWDSASSKDGAR